MTIRKKYFNGEPYLECETTQDWIDALWMDLPIHGPAEVKIALLEAEVRNLRRIAAEAISASWATGNATKRPVATRDSTRAKEPGRQAGFLTASSSSVSCDGPRLLVSK